MKRLCEHKGMNDLLDSYYQEWTDNKNEHIGIRMSKGCWFDYFIISDDNSLGGL